MTVERQPEPVDDLYEAVFHTPEGLAVVTGIGVAATVGIPAILVSFAVPSPEGYKEQKAEIDQLQKDVASLTPALNTLSKSGDNDLAAGVQSKVEVLNQQIATAQANLPSHTTFEAINNSLLAAPFIVGALAGVVTYRRFKKKMG